MKQIDRYVVQAELGSGGAGIVYRAYDPEIRRSVAIKVLLGLDERQRARLRREGRALAALRHPSVVSLYATGEWHGKPYLVLEFVEGSSLQARLDATGPLEPREVIAMGLALSSALEAVHAHGLLHRDLKPDNVLLNVEGEPLLTDFGLVKFQQPGDASQHLTVSGTLQGTPGFWSPEQAAGAHRQVSPTTDVYGLGATLYAALTNRPPVDADTLRDLLLATARREPTPPSKLRAGVPPDLEAVVLTCLQKAPQDRYPSAAAVGEALRAVQQEAAPARSSPRLRTAAPWLLLAVGAILAVFFATRASDPEPSAPAPTEAVVPSPPRPTPEALFAKAQAQEKAAGPAAALSDLEAAAQAGHLGAMIRLGQILSQEQSVPRDDAQAALWFRRAAEADDPQGMSELGFMLAYGRGVPRDEVMAREWFRRAAQAGNPEGMSNLSWALENGLGGPAEPGAALSWRQRAVDAGHPAALVSMGLALIDGDGVPAEPERGMKLLERAAAAGNTLALTWLGRYTRMGRGVPSNPARALDLYLRAAEAGSDRGYTLAAQMLIEGDGVPVDTERGESLLRKAIARGDVPALTILGQYLEVGRLGRTDPQEARVYYTKAAVANDPGGMYWLGRAMSRGLGGPVALEESLMWLRRSAEAEYLPAMFDLGQACERGIAPGGVPEARRWYAAAAKAGHAGAEQALAALD